MVVLLQCLAPGNPGRRQLIRLLTLAAGLKKRVITVKQPNSVNYLNTGFLVVKQAIVDLVVCVWALSLHVDSERGTGSHC